MPEFDVMQYLAAFACGGLLCLIGQILLDKTALSPARILVSYVVAGALLGALGIYKPIADWGGAGASVPLTGFGYSLYKGVVNGIEKSGFLGVFSGGLTASAAGIATAIFSGLLVALIFKQKTKR